jgi:AraC-like DNA-binding protein
MFSLAAGCQRLAGDAFHPSSDKFKEAVARFERGLPAAVSDVERMVLRDRVIENATKAADLFHRSFHRRFSPSACQRRPFEEAAAVWGHSDQDVRRLLTMWRDVFLSQFHRDHPWPLAQQAAAVLRHRYAEPLTIDGLAHELGCARTRLIREFRTSFGMSLATYLTRVRLQYGLRGLRDASYSVDAIARIVGYRSPKNFYRALHSVTGLLPTEVRALSGIEFELLLEAIQTGSGS